MNIRLQITFFLILISLLGVTGTSFFILQTATTDKKNYVTELSSVLGPQIKDSVDQKIQALLLDLKDFSDIIESNSSATKTKSLETLKSRLKNVETIVISKSNKLITINLSGNEIAAPDFFQNVTSQNTSQNQLTFMKNNIYLFKTSHNNLAAVILNPDFFKDSFDLARGKKSLLISGQKQILYASSDDSSLIQHLPASLFEGAELLTTEVSDNHGHSLLTNFAKLGRIENSFVLILTPQVTWQDLAAPLFKSSISLILILILFSVVIAYYISRSLAQPIEQLAAETSKIGIGEWKNITPGGSNEIAKLAQAFNRMIFNLKTRENELKVAHNKLIQSESLAAVGRMSAGIAHEVKNPLSSVLSYCQLIDINLKSLPAETEKLEKFKNYNKMVIDDTRRANKIITDLLTFSRQKELQTEKINLRDFALNIEPKLKALCEASGVDFSSALNLDAPAHFINIDSDQIYQVLFNLVQNAVHALSSQETLKSVKLSCDISDENAYLAISDNGPGISSENISKIFEPFFSTKKVGEGSGLGLAICYGIVLQHGGQILVESVPHQSTCFKVKLPLLIAT